MSGLVTSMLLETSLKATVLLLAALLASRLLRAAAGRHQVLVAGLLGVLALPLAAGLVPAWAPPVAQLPAAAGSTAIATIELARPAQALADAAPVAAAPRIVEPLNAWVPTLLTVFRWSWALGVAVCLGPLVSGLWYRRALAHGSRTVWSGRLQRRLDTQRERLQLRRSVRLLVTRRRALPVTWGVVRPTVLLPAQAYRWSNDRLDDVLLHELVHVARLDAATRTLSQIACAVLWFHPLAWLAARRLRREQELACDDAVLAAGADAHDYATTLVALARGLRESHAAVTASLAVARPSSVERRVTSILDPRQEHRTMTTRNRLLLIFCFLALLLPLAGLSPGRAAQEQSEATATAAPGRSERHTYHTWNTDDLTVVVQRDGELLLGESPQDLRVAPGGSLLVRAWRRHPIDADRSEEADYRFEMTAGTGGSTTSSWRVDGQERPVDTVTFEWLQPILAGLTARERQRDGAERDRAARERHRDTIERERSDQERIRDEERVRDEVRARSEARRRSEQEERAREQRIIEERQRAEAQAARERQLAIQREYEARQRIEQQRQAEIVAQRQHEIQVRQRAIEEQAAPPATGTIVPQPRVEVEQQLVGSVPLAGEPTLELQPQVTLEPQIAVAPPLRAVVEPRIVIEPQVSVAPPPRAVVEPRVVAEPPASVPPPPLAVVQPRAPLAVEPPARGSRWHGWHGEDGSIVRVQTIGDVKLGSRLESIEFDGDGELRVSETLRDGTERLLWFETNDGVEVIRWSIDGELQPLDETARKAIAELLERIEASAIR